MRSLSVKTKLTVLFSFSGIAACLLAGAAFWLKYEQRVLTDELQALERSHALVERINGLVYAVVMDSRGVYMAAKPEEAKKFAEGQAKSLDKLTATLVGRRQDHPRRGSPELRFHAGEGRGVSPLPHGARQGRRRRGRPGRPRDGRQ